VPAKPILARVPVSQRFSPVVRAAEAAFDLSEVADDVDLSVGSDAMTSAPLASENVRLRIRMRGYDVNLLAEAVEQIRIIADTTGSTFKGPVMLPTRKKLYCVLRSPHVNKDSREHFEVRTHHR
jgi:small subunit ribosomal protein S10